MADRVGALRRTLATMLFWILALVIFTTGVVLITLAVWDHHR